MAGFLRTFEFREKAHRDFFVFLKYNVSKDSKPTQQVAAVLTKWPLKQSTYPYLPN